MHIFFEDTDPSRFAGAATGAHPTDRSKQGTKRSLLIDGAGIPLALIANGAHRHDVKQLSATLDGLVISRPEPTEKQLQHLCLDAASDSTPISQELLARHDQPHVRRRGEEQHEKESIPGYRARRWVVQRSHSWINRSRRLLVRWEKKGENYLAFLHLVCAQLIFAKLVVFE